MKYRSREAYNIADLRELARRRLPKGIFEFIDRGTEDEIALYNNRAAFDRIKLMPRTPIDVLPEVVDSVGKRVTVIVDCGFRRGSDIVKALALGAAAVLIGRATLYGTAVAGEAGAARAIGLLREEIDRVLALLGCLNVASLSRDYLMRA